MIAKRSALSQLEALTVKLLAKPDIKNISQVIHRPTYNAHCMPIYIFVIKQRVNVAICLIPDIKKSSEDEVCRLVAPLASHKGLETNFVVTLITRYR